MLFNKLVSLFLDISLPLLVTVIIFDSATNIDNAVSQYFNFFLFGLTILLYINYWYKHRSKKLALNLIFDDEINELGVIVNKIVTPFLLYFTVLAYMHFNVTKNVMLPVMLGLFVIFMLYFINIKSFFSKKERREQSTDIVFDLIKFLIFFMGIDVITNLFVNEELDHLKTIFVCFLLNILLSLLMVFRLKNIKLKYVLAVLLISLILNIFYLILLNQLYINITIVAFVMLTLFYLLHGLFFSYIFKKLNKETFIEFGGIIILVFSILYFLR